MGSFANSVHVRSDDAQDVVAAIQSAMRDTAYEPTDEEPDEEAAWGMPSPLRAVHVSATHNGWVGVLDSDLLGSVHLAVDLSRRLATHSIQFMVNDSDSWGYQLCRDGEALDEFDADEFDSTGESADEIDSDDTPRVFIQPFFANLSYRYLEESSPAELRSADIEMIAHLKFQQ